MTVDPASIEAITLDSFTTLVDVHGPTRAALSRYVEDPIPVARLWRSRAIDYRMVATFIGEFEPYDQTTREALEFALEAFDVDVSEADVADIAGVFEDLEVFEDVRPGVKRLSDAGYDVYILSNGTPAMLDSIIDRAGIDGFVSDSISASEISAYKPDARIYEHGARRAGHPTDAVLHAATPWYDVYGAMGAGMPAVWVNRRGRPWDAFDGRPDAIVDGFPDLCQLLDA